MRILQFAPNAGVSLSSGGGTLVALQMAEILGGDLGHEVWVAGYHAFPLDVLEELHNVDLRGAHVSLTTSGSDRLFWAAKGAPVKLSPYNLLATQGFRRWVRATIEKVDPDLVWFHDDIPRAALDCIEERSVFLYVHFPLEGRNDRITPGLAGNRGIIERVNDAILTAVGTGLVASPNAAGVRELWVNSLVTQAAVQAVWGRPSRVVYPYVSKPRFAYDPARKSPLISAIGSFTRAKGFHRLLEGFARAKLSGWSMVIAGHARDRGYLHFLAQLARQLGITQSVQFRTDIASNEMEALLDHSSVICGGAAFEPLGLALLQGMSSGAVPVTLESSSSGGWVDVCLKGEVGFGFRNVDDLAELFKKLSTIELEGSARAAIGRSESFSRVKLKSELERATR
jgi:glycosyltransferase involved in cell wall biosynthesis